MLLKRPEAVIFDPSLKEHRVAVRLYMKRKAWSDSPLKFAYDPAYGSVADQVQTKLLQWYLDQEETRDKKRAERDSDKPAVKTKPALVEVKSGPVVSRDHATELSNWALKKA